MSDSKPKWKRFEEFVGNLQKQISPQAKVTIDDHIEGRRSGVQRQIDISVRQTVGQFNLLTVLECKDHKDPIDVKGVEDFLGLAEDVGANKAAIVSSSGFTDAAIARAKDAGVDLFRLVDAESEDWSTYVAIPFVCDFRGFGFVRFIFGGSKSICAELADLDPKLIQIFDEHQELVSTPLTMLWNSWNRRELSEKPGRYRKHLRPGKSFVKNREGEFEEIGIIAEFDVQAKYYFGHLPLTKVTGLRDESTGDLILPGQAEIITDWIDAVEVERSWLRIPSIDALAVKPFAVLTAFDIYPESIPDSEDEVTGDA